MDIAPRKLILAESSTPAHVGPNTYSVTYPCCKYGKNVVPFLSTAERKPDKLRIYTDKIYNPPDVRSKIKYGNSLQFTAPRVTIDINMDPPPRKELKRDPYCVNPRKKANTGRLFVCRVPFSKGVNGPSIPSHNDVNGYLLTEDNDLIKIPPTDHDITLGPAFYNVPKGEVNFNSKRYKGCAWSKMTGQRSKLSANDNPGPGEYDVKFITCPRHKEDEKFRELMRKCCNVPRYTCLLYCRAKRNGFPGPGDYETVDMDKLGKPKNLSLKPLPFIDSAERFVYKSTIGPGPQRYLVCDCFKRRKDFSLKDVPFLTEANRFSSKPPDNTLGPGQYDVTEVKCIRYTSNKRASFNSTEERKLLEIHNTNPGPGQYCVRMKGVRCCPQELPNRTSVFSSMRCRFSRRKSEDQPEPASYMTTKAFNYVHDKQSHATGKCVPFGTSDPKFKKIHDFAGIKAGGDAPSVGVYNLPKLSKSAGISIPAELRFPNKIQEKRPGPVTYTLHPVVGDAMYRGRMTHNKRLMVDVVKRITRHQAYNTTTEKPKSPRKKRSSDWLTIEEIPAPDRKT